MCLEWRAGQSAQEDRDELPLSGVIISLPPSPLVTRRNELLQILLVVTSKPCILGLS
jgi:hypothetical protein